MLLSIYKLDESTSDEKPVCILREGEHIIGRGELLQCNDKRASRAHASINIVDANATITSMHQNPCFFQAAISETIVILTKDVPMELNEGDKFGLFPDQYWFKVKVEDENSNLRSHETITSQKRSLDENMYVLPSKTIKLDDSHNVYSAVENIDINSHNVEHNTYIEHSNDQNISSTTINVPVKEELSCSDDESIDVKTEEEIADTSKSIENANNTVESDTVSNQASSNTNNTVVESDTVSNQTSSNTNNTVVESDNVSNQASSSASPGDAKANDKKDATLLREKCWYGSNCYRKNAEHKKNFSHPGDADYDSDPNDTRPVCSFGADCYRKNKDHRKEYKHPSTTRKRRAKSEIYPMFLFCKCHCCAKHFDLL